MTSGRSDWLDDLEVAAPDIVAAYRGIEAERFVTVRREVRKRAGPGTTEALVVQLGAAVGALSAIVRRLPDEAFGWPGGEADWNIAQAVGHDAAARSGLVMAASLAAGGRWPVDAPTVVPGVPGPATADGPTLVAKLEQSQRIVSRAARAVVGHEADPCLLDHPLVGRLRCGEWLLFAGVHDLMHLEQLQRIAAAFAEPTPIARGSD